MGLPTDATAPERLRANSEPAAGGLLGWWHAASAASRRALVAFSLVLASVIAELGLTKAQAGALGSVTLLGGAAGGLIFGHIADRFGRTRAMIASMLLYSVFTAA